MAQQIAQAQQLAQQEAQSKAQQQAQAQAQAQQQAIIVPETAITTATGEYFAFNTLYSILTPNDKTQFRLLCSSVKQSSPGLPQPQVLQKVVATATMYFGQTVVDAYVTIPLLQMKVVDALNKKAGELKAMIQTQYATEKNMKAVSQNIDIQKAMAGYVNPVQAAAGTLQLNPYAI
jgi:hypothetical protein